jgi:SOS response regulatory protein OraA/RecX
MKSGSKGASLSLRARALQYLARREYCRAELRGKLSAWEEDWNAPGMEAYDRP